MKQHQLPVDALVELQDEFADLYPNSPPGARGWVRARRPDEYGYPHVYVEWDKEHWRYRGEQDGWAFENHFRVVNSPSKTIESGTFPGKKVHPASAFADAMVNEEEEPQGDHQGPVLEPCPTCGQGHSSIDLERQAYLETLLESQEDAMDSDGFFTVTVRAKPDPENPGKVMFEPEMYSSALTNEARVMLEAQIIHLAALAHQSAVRERVQRLRGSQDEPGR